MSKERPTVSFRQQWRGYKGKLKCGAEEISEISHFVIRRPKYRPHKRWDVAFSVPGELSPMHTELQTCQPSELHLVGTTYSNETIKAHLLNIEPPAVSVHNPPEEYHFEASATQIDVGLGTLPSSPFEQRVQVVFSGHALTQKEIQWLVHQATGEVNPIGDAEQDEERSTASEPLSWSTRHGQGNLWLRFNWESASTEGEKAYVQVPEPRLEIEIPEGRRSEKIPEVITGIRDDVQWLIRLLSLFSRRHVRCLEIRVLSRWGDGGPGERLTSRTLWTGSPSERDAILDPVLRSGPIPPEALEKVRATIDGLVYSDAVSSAIGFLIESFRADFIEGQLAAAFTALETMVNAVGDAQGITAPVEGGEFYRLKGKLEAVVEDYEPKDYDLQDVDRGHLKRKLGAISRRPFAARAAQTVKKIGAQWEDLWPSDTELEHAISEAYSRRSDLVHTGQIPEDGDWYVDQFRIHALAERMVLAALQIPDDWMPLDPYQHCRGLSEEPV